jgi:hypothetical protein
MSIPNTAFSSHQTSQSSHGRRGALPLAAPAIAVASHSPAVSSAATATTAAAQQSALSSHGLPATPEACDPSTAVSAPSALASSPWTIAGAVLNVIAHASPHPQAASLLSAHDCTLPAASTAAEPTGASASIFDEMRAHCNACQRNYKDSEYRIYGKRCLEPVPFYYDPLDKIFHREFREGRVACCMIQVL